MFNVFLLRKAIILTYFFLRCVITETVIPTVNERSPVFLLNSIAYLVWSAVQSNELEGAVDLGWRLLCADPLITYLTEVNSLPFQNLPVCPWFGRAEVSLLYRIVRLRVALETKRVKVCFFL